MAWLISPVAVQPGDPPVGMSDSDVSASRHPDRPRTTAATLAGCHCGKKPARHGGHWFRKPPLAV